MRPIELSVSPRSGCCGFLLSFSAIRKSGVEIQADDSGKEDQRKVFEYKNMSKVAGSCATRRFRSFVFWDSLMIQVGFDSPLNECENIAARYPDKIFFVAG